MSLARFGTFAGSTALTLLIALILYGGLWVIMKLAAMVSPTL